MVKKNISILLLKGLITMKIKYLIPSFMLLLSSCGNANAFSEINDSVSGSAILEDETMNYKKAAIVMADELNINDSDITVSNVKDKKILAVLSRELFGEIGERYKFDEDRVFTRYDLAKASIYIYANLLCVDDENLEPGKQVLINDISDYSVMQRWYIYASISFGFMKLKNNLFNPKSVVTKDEIVETINVIKEKANREILPLEKYKEEKLKNFKTCQNSNSIVNSFLDVYKPSDNQGERLLATSLQGLVNRDVASIYIDMLNDAFETDYAISKGYISGINSTYTDVYQLLEKYVRNKHYNKFVVYETNSPYLINTATDIAAVEDRLIINETMVDRIKGIVTNPDFLFLSDLNLKSQYQAQQYVYNNYYQHMRRDMLGWSYYGKQQDFVRDYPIQMKYPTLWIPGSNSEDYDSDTINLVGDILQEYPANIPVIGFQYANNQGLDMGIGEFKGVTLCGEYGKYTCVFDTVGNLSFHTNIKVNPEELKFKSKNNEYETYSKDKKYVAITMTESGDSPAYIQYGLRQYQITDGVCGSIPYNISYGLNCLNLLPMHTQYFFENSGDMTYYFGAISGLGYCYPISSFGSKGVKNENGIYMRRVEILKDHYIKANEILKQLGFDCLAVYGYPDYVWNKYDTLDFNDYVLKYLTNVKTIMADMHRPSYYNNEDLVVETDSNITLYHCATFWSYDELGNPNNTALDNKAVEYLYNEIINHTKNGQFFQCMAYSWHFGPRRIKLVMDKINQDYPGMYEFVTINQLDYYYQKSKGE